ncbi:MAG: LysR family transcriptional regulator [Acidobacteria bacterium]|nr:LysR family transcriptional regulator [Acidobacteriota bacterium]
MTAAQEGIELSHLYYFVAVAEELHFGRAARRLAISQPPLTQQIQKLEQRVGYPLFERSTRRTELTAAGAAMLPVARAALAEADRAMDAARRSGRGDAGQLVLATPPSLLLTALPSVIRQFRRTLPDVDLRLAEMSTAAALEALRTGSAGIALLRSPILPDGLLELHRFHEPLIAVIPRGRKGVTVAALKRQPFVFFPRRLGPAFHDELIEQFGFEPRVTQEATQWSSVLALVEAGIGVTAGPASIAKLAGRGCAILKLPNAKTTVLAACGSRNPLADRFVDAMKRSPSFASPPSRAY